MSVDRLSLECVCLSHIAHAIMYCYLLAHYNIFQELLIPLLHYGHICRVVKVYYQIKQMKLRLLINDR